MSNRANRAGSRWTARWTLRSGRAALAILFVSLLLAAPVQAEGRFENLGPSTFDVAILRPLTALQVVVGVILFIPTSALTSLPMLPFSRDVAKANVDEAFDIFVREPYERTALRPLGAW